MKFKKIHPNFALPLRGSSEAGGLDIYMPYSGTITQEPQMFPLGFAAAVPKGHVALILPRSGVGAKKGLELNNTVGVIDSDYRGEWLACMRVKPGHKHLRFEETEKLLQIVVVPVADITPELVDDLDSTERGEGGFGSTSEKAVDKFLNLPVATI